MRARSTVVFGLMAALAASSHAAAAKRGPLRGSWQRIKKSPLHGIYDHPKPSIFRGREELTFYTPPNERSETGPVTYRPGFAAEPKQTFSDYMWKAALRGVEFPVRDFSSSSNVPRDETAKLDLRQPLSKFGRTLAAVSKGRVWVDLGAGDPEQSVVPRHLAAAMGAAGYVAVEGNLKRTVSTRRAAFVRDDISHFLGSMDHPGGALARPAWRGKGRVFMLHGIEPSYVPQEIPPIVHDVAKAAGPDDYIYLGTASYLFGVLERMGFERVAKSTPVMELDGFDTRRGYLSNSPLHLDPDLADHHVLMRRRGASAIPSPSTADVAVGPLLRALRLRTQTFDTRAIAAEEVSLAGQLATHGVETNRELVGRIMGGSNSAAKSALVASIAKSREHDAATETLFALLRDPSFTVSLDAAHAFAVRMTTDDKARTRLQDALADRKLDRSGLVKYALKSYLVARPDSTEFHPALLKLIEGWASDQPLALRAGATLAMSQAQPEQVEAALIKLIEAPDGRLRQKITKPNGEVGFIYRDMEAVVARLLESRDAKIVDRTLSLYAASDRQVADLVGEVGQRLVAHGDVSRAAAVIGSLAARGLLTSEVRESIWKGSEASTHEEKAARDRLRELVDEHLAPGR